MKKYLLFYGLHYYPGGGMSDYYGDFDTIEEIDEFLTQEKLKNTYSWDWFDIIEHSTMKLVKQQQ